MQSLTLNMESIGTSKNVLSRNFPPQLDGTLTGGDHLTARWVNAQRWDDSGA